MNNEVTTELIRCRPWIEAALEYSGGTHDFMDVVDGVLIGRFQLWPTPRGCLVTEIVNYPKKKSLHVFLAGGELDQILDVEDSLRVFGRSQGCDSMTLAGRPGWKKALPHWKQDFVVLSTEIETTA